MYVCSSIVSRYSYNGPLVRRPESDLMVRMFIDKGCWYCKSRSILALATYLAEQ